MNPSTSLYQIKVSCPYYSHELVLTFSSYGSLLLDHWLDNPSMRSGLRYSTNTSTPRALFFLPLLLLSVCSSCSGPSLEPFVNINLNPSLTEPEELLYQSIQHLLVCIQLSPYDSLSVLNLLSSLLYETGDIDFFYTYSIYTSIFDILNITEESIATYMDQHPNSRKFPPFFIVLEPSFYEHYSAHELYELIQQKAIFVLYQVFSFFSSWCLVLLLWELFECVLDGERLSPSRLYHDWDLPELHHHSFRFTHLVFLFLSSP